MNNDIATALSLLRFDPEDKASWEVITALRSVEMTEESAASVRRLISAEQAFHTENEHVALALQLLDVLLALEKDSLARANLLLEKARLLHAGEHRLEAALSSANEALALAPGHEAASAFVKEVEAESTDFESRMEALTAQASDTKDKSAAASAFVAKAELLLRHRPRSEKIETMLRRALELDPQHRRADVLLERLLSSPQRRADLLAHLQRRIDAALGPAEKSSGLAALGRLRLRQDERQEALSDFRAALLANPGNEAALHFLAILLSKPEDVDELVKVYEAALKASKRGPAESVIALALGEVMWERQNRFEDAEPYFRKARKSLPYHPKVVAYYRAYHVSRDELPQIITLLLQAQKAEQNVERRIQYGMDLAEIAERKPQFLEKAIDAWKSLLRLRPGMAEAVQALRRLFTKTEKWNALLELLKDQCEALPATEVDLKVERYLEMVPIYRDKLKLEVMVINTYASILQIKPDHAAAMAALAELYEAQGRWGDLAGVRMRQAQAATDPAQKAALYHRVAALWIEKFGNHHNAIGALEKVIEAMPSDEKARHMLREIYTRGRSWRALLDLYRRELPLLSPEARQEQLAVMAALAADRLADIRQSIALWNEVLVAAPFDRRAVNALATLYEREKRWPALAEILIRLAEWSGAEKTPEGRAFLERRGILLLEKLGAGEAAIADLQRVRSAEPDHPRVLRALREAYAHHGDLESLESLYAGRQAWDELCDVLSALADRTADMRLRTRALERVAYLGKEKLNQTERVLKAYEGILATNPERREIARAAAQIYKHTERYGRYVATLEIILGPETSPALSVEESLPILAEARDVCETKMEAKGLAFKWCARAYRLAPTDTRVRKELMRLAKLAEEWEFLLALFIERQGMVGPQGPNPEERLFLLRSCLELVTARLDRPADVQRFAETILSEVPGDPDAEAALITLYSSQERWAELVSLQHARANRMTDSLARADALVRVARIEEEKLSDRPAAIRSLQAALQADPTHVRVLKELSRLLQEAADPRSLVIVLSRLVELVDDADRAEVQLHIGQVSERELGDFAQATRSYLQTLEVDAINAEAVRGLERLLAGDLVRTEDRGAVARRLAPYYELTENYARWAATLEALLKVAESEEERQGTLDILADLYAGPLGDTLSAYGSVLRLFESNPRRASVRHRLVQLGELVGKLPEIASVATRLLQGVEDPALRLDLLMFIADVEERQPARLSDAEAALREVLELDPLHLGAYKTLCRFCKEAERWSALRDLVSNRERHLPDLRQRTELLWQVVEIDEGLLYDRPHATETLRRIIELVPDDLRAYRILERHYTDAEKWRELDNLLASEVPLLGKPEIADLKMRRADLALARFHEPFAAIQFVIEVLDLIPAHPYIVPLLERCLGEPEVRQRAAALLAPLLASSGQWARLADIISIEAEGMEGVAQGELYARKAELEEKKLGEPAVAFATWRLILEKDPSSEQALSQVERLGTALGRHRDLIAIYEKLVDQHERSDLAGIADLLGRAARLWTAHEPERKAAIQAWRRVLDLDPSIAEIGRPAVDALESLYAEVGDFSGLVYVLRCRADWTPDPIEQGQLILRVADLEENFLRDVEKATATYQTLLEGPPSIAERAFAQLDRIYQKTAQPKERVGLLKDRLDRAEKNERRTLRLRIAAITENELGNVPEAVAVLRPALDDDPDDQEILRILARLFVILEAPTDRLEVLERLLQLASTEPQKIAETASIAVLLAGPLGRPSEALDKWREILKMDSANAQALSEVENLLGSEDASLRSAAAETLEPLYTARGDARKLAGLLRIFIDLSEDAVARSSIRARLAEIEERQLGDRPAAFRTWAAAIRDATSDAGLDRLLDAYERLAVSLGGDAVRNIVQLYRDIEPDILSDTTRIRVQQTVANHAISLGDFPVAIDYLHRLIERRPEDDSALQALEKIHRQREEWQPLYEIVVRRAELAQSVKAELGLRREAATLARRLGHLEEAIASWERVFALKPSDSEASLALDSLYSESNRWNEVANLIERRLGLGVSAGDAIDLRYRLAEIMRVKLSDRHRALEYLAKVLSADANHAQAIQNLQELLDDPEVCVEAANLLEPVYIRRNAWKDLVAIDSLRLKNSEDLELHLSWTERIAQIYEEQIEDLNEAFNWYARVFQQKPTDPAAMEPLLRLAPKLERWRDVGKLLDEYLDNELSNSEEVLVLVRHAIRVYDQELDDRDAARRHYRRLVDVESGDRKASQQFESALERWEAWRELRDHLEEQARLVDNQDVRASLLRRSAYLSDDRLSDAGSAITAIRTVLEIQPDDKEAAAFLSQLFTSEGRYDDLRDHLLWMLSRTDHVGTQDTLTLELADVEGTHLGNLMGAVDYYGEVLSRTPNHPSAISALEDLISAPELRSHVAELLEPAYRTIRDLRKLADVLAIRLESLLDVEARILALREIATLEAHLGRYQEALEARGKAWLEDVTNAETLVELESQATASSGYARLVEILEKGAEDAADPELCGDLHAFRANILEARLGNPAAAILAWRKALEARPDHRDSFLALERLLAHAGKVEELCDVLERHAEVASDARDREQLTKRVATLYEYPLLALPKAIAAWRTVLDQAPSDQEALDALIRLTETTGDSVALIDVLLRKIEVCHDLIDLRALRMKAAEVYDEKLSEPSEAVGQLRAVLADLPEDAVALEKLGTLFARDNQTTDLVEVLDRRVRLVQDTATRWALAFQAAAVTQQSLGDIAGAVRRYERILEENPGHSEARQALWELARGEDLPGAAIAVLEPLLRSGQEWKALCEILELRLKTVDLPADRVRVLKDIAQVQERLLIDLPGSFKTTARALAEEPGNEELQNAVERLARAANDYAGLAEVYEERLKESYDVALQRTFGSRLALLCEGVLGKPGRAVELWGEVATLPGAEEGALFHQEVLLRQLGRTEDLAEVLQREAELAKTPEKQAEYWAELGMVLLGSGDVQLGTPEEEERAIEAFHRALERNPSQEKALAALRAMVVRKPPSVAVLDILEELAESNHDDAGLVSLLEIRLTIKDEPTEAASLLRRIADIQEERLRSPSLAIEALSRALALDPASEISLEKMEAVAEKSHLLGEAARQLAAVLPRPESMFYPMLALRAAKLHLASQQLEGETIALGLYQKVLQLDPENAAALEAVEGIYRRQGDLLHLAEICEQRGGLELDSARRLNYFAEAARLHEAAGDLHAAVAAWRAGRAGDESQMLPLDELIRLLDAMGDFPALVEILREKAQYEDDGDARADALVRVAELQAGPLDDRNAAVDTLKEALDYSPSHSLALAVLAELEELRGDYLALEEALLRQSGTVLGTERLDVLAKLAKNAKDHLNDPERALVYLQQMLTLEGNNRYAIAECEKLFSELERWHDLIELLERLAELEAGAGRTESELACRVKIATLWEERLGSEENAFEALNAVLARDPSHGPSLLAIARIHQSAERWEEATNALEKAAAVVTRRAEKADLFFQRAKITEAMGGQAEDVVALYQSALAQDPSWMPPLLALEELARKKNDLRLLATVLEARLDRESSVDKEKAILTELSGLYLGSLGQPGEAVPLLERLAKHFPDDGSIKEKLASALIAAGRVDEGEFALEQLIGQLTKARKMKEVARLRTLLGTSAEARGDLALALQRFLGAFQIDPTQSTVLGSLARLALRQKDDEAAKRYLRTLLLQNFDEKATGITKAEIYFELGRLHLQAGENAKARNLFERGLETDPRNEALKKALAETPR